MHRPTTPQDDYHNSFDSAWDSVSAGPPGALPGSASPFHGVGGYGSNVFGGGGGEFDGVGSNPFANTGSADFGLAGFNSGASPFEASTPSSLDGGGSTSFDGSGIGSSTWTPTSPSADSDSSGPVSAVGDAGAGVASDPTASASQAADFPLPESIQVRLLVTGKAGTIVDASAAPTYTVEVAGGGGVEKVNREELAVVAPLKKDRLIILKGEHRGSTGTLIGIDGTDGIVKMTANSDIKILDLECCAKLAEGMLG